MHPPTISSPYYLIDENRLRQNLQLIQNVSQAAGVNIILAFKGFAMWKTFPILREYINGATASSLHEARLCVEEMKSLAHTYSPVYKEEEFAEILKLSSHLTFNSLNQYERFFQQVKNYERPVSIGLRVNPEWSDVETDLYNPAAPSSRLGILYEDLADGLPEGVEGLHFHVLCESDSYALEKVLAAFEQRFAHLIPKLKWINMGGGHLMTRKGYNTAHLIEVLQNFKKKHGIELILEPGSAFVWETGELVSTVLDIVNQRGVKTAILDVSFTAHMPDTLEMPYRPKIIGATEPEKGKPTYRLGGNSCLAGDFMGAYSFEKPLEVGDQLIFLDMIHYTMVKTTTFNGVQHPSIAMQTSEGKIELFKAFGYADFKNRLS